MSFRCGIPIIRQECAAVAAEGHLCRARLVCVRCVRTPCLCRLRALLLLLLLSIGIRCFQTIRPLDNIFNPTPSHLLSRPEKANTLNTYKNILLMHGSELDRPDRHMRVTAAVSDRVLFTLITARRETTTKTSIVVQQHVILLLCCPYRSYLIRSPIMT